MAWAGRSPAVADRQHLIVKSCWKISSLENVTLCMSSNTLFSQCSEASEVAQSLTLGAGLHARVVFDVSSVTSSLSERFGMDRNSSFHLKHIPVSQEIATNLPLLHCRSKPWTLRWWEAGGVWGEAQFSYVYSPARNQKRILSFCSDWSCSDLRWTKNSKQWFKLSLTK